MSSNIQNSPTSEFKLDDNLENYFKKHINLATIFVSSDHHFEIAKQEHQTLPPEMLSLLECPVCKVDYMDEPKSLSCGHTFCKVCSISIWETSRNVSNYVKCPTCRQYSTSSHTNPANVIIKQVQELIRFHCTLPGCNQISQGLTSAKKHSMECPKNPVQCANHGCQWKGSPDEYKDHAETCSYTAFVCSFCRKSSIKSYQRKEHLQSCGAIPIRCRNKDCPVVLPKKYMKKHNRICFKRVTKCSRLCQIQMQLGAINMHRQTCELFYESDARNDD